MCRVSELISRTLNSKRRPVDRSTLFYIINITRKPECVLIKARAKMKES